MAKLSDWRPYDQYVQGGLTDGKFLSAAFTMVAAGPPRLSNMGTAASVAKALGSSSRASDFAMPVGIVQNVALAHNRNFARFWELGSERSYFIAGRTTGQLSLSRIMYHGPSLLRMMYAYYADYLPPTVINAVFPAVGAIQNRHNVKIPAGFDNLYMNLASDLFSQPVGLLLYLRDSDEQTVGASYLEACYVPSHQIATDAGGVVIQEQASAQFERLVPVSASSVSLVTGFDLVA